MASKKFDITLQPGETLVTKPWEHVSAQEACARYHRGEDPLPTPAGPYRQFWVDSLGKTGSYRIKAVYDDTPLPPDEEEIQRMLKTYGQSREKQLKYHQRILSGSLGHWESNEISIEVVP